MAGDSSTAVRNALVARLLATSAVTDIVGQRVYDVRAEGDEYPLIVFGDENSSPWDAYALDGEEVFVLINGYCDQEGHSVQARALKVAIRNALHEATLTVAGHDFLLCRVQDSRIVPTGAKDRISHAIVRVKIITN
jgi:hypothetical protein